MTFENYLSEKKAYVWRFIDQRLREYQAADVETLRLMQQEQYVALLDEHWNICRDYPERQGKYLRPALVLLMAEAMGVGSSQAVATAAAMQMSEDWILIHDDLEDGSLQRRGKPALHRLVGAEIAINAGDTLHEAMHRILSENYQLLDVGMAHCVSQEFFRMLSRTTFGQYAEIKWTLENKPDMTERDVLFTISGKTVYYTIAGPLRLGAIMAGATDEQLAKIYRFSYPLGVCFQIRDDVLDLTSDFEGQKKQKLNDIYEGKRTLILLHLLRHATPDERARIEEILSKPREQKQEQEVDYIRQLMDVYGSIDYAEEEARRYAEEAMEQLQHIDFITTEDYRQLFRQMVEFILNRAR